MALGGSFSQRTVASISMDNNRCSEGFCKMIRGRIIQVGADLGKISAMDSGCVKVNPVSTMAHNFLHKNSGQSRGQ
jgi:hypothetical protein